MSEMVRKVRDAIMESVMKHDQSYASLEEIARKAIEAMREPTEAMVEAADCDSKDQALTIWRDMTDEALK